jgi:hypothetical protein
MFHTDQQPCRSLHPDLQMRKVDHGVIARVRSVPHVVAGKIVLSQTQNGSSTGGLDCAR